MNSRLTVDPSPKVRASWYLFPITELLKVKTATMYALALLTHYSETLGCVRETTSDSVNAKSALSPIADIGLHGAGPIFTRSGSQSSGALFAR